MTCVACLAITFAFSFLLQVAMCRPLSGWDQETHEDGLEHYEDEVFPEDHSGFDFDVFLESVKDEFFRGVNLSEIPSQDPLEAEPPQFMIDLYNKFASDSSSMPSSNIVRSFRNEDTTTVLPVGEHGARRHILVFNLTIPRHEVIVAAELRLYAFVARDRRLYEGVNRIVRVHDLENSMSLLVSKQIAGEGSGWETFDVTDAVSRWVRSNRTTHKLEVHIESAEERDSGAVVAEGEPGSESRNVPLLVVFSDDQRRGQGDEVKEMLVHEQDVAAVELAVSEGPEYDLSHPQTALSLDSTSRTRRSAKGNYCKRTPLHVDFTEIGWDSWIVAPKDYEAYECRGVCYIPLTDHVTPTNHAKIQTLVNHWNPDKAAKACCVPTKLDPISMLYKNNAGVTTYKYKYEEMVVVECGCR
ncbi:bone morphogenetic protein 10-like [Leucoraja erinacea]|uniref:bone morphogenetic protein 10-like n=1 Tax=Leucoraja erinaceus TaxID=7782 RepID=UPI002458F66F|nr:bone morphogenetic protein 10-like [Leucoraja erinacea]